MSQFNLGEELKGAMRKEVLKDYHKMAHNIVFSIEKAIALGFNINISGRLDGSAESLRVLDEVLSLIYETRSPAHSPISRCLIFPLGAYIGDVIIRELRGKWVIRKPYHNSSVKIDAGKVSINMMPFHWAHSRLSDEAEEELLYPHYLLIRSYLQGNLSQRVGDQ